MNAELCLCLTGTCVIHSRCFGILPDLLSISWTSDTRKVYTGRRDSLNQHARKQGESGTLDTWCVFALQIQEGTDSASLPISIHEGQHCAVYRFHILRKRFTQMVPGSWLPFSLKCPSKYLTRNKALWITATLCWLWSLCQAFAREWFCFCFFFFPPQGINRWYT